MQDGELLQAIARFAERVTKRPVQVEHARGHHLDGQLAHEGQRDGGDAACLDFPGEQPHGPRADRSGRHEQSEIDVSLREQLADFASLWQQFLRLIGEAKTILRVSNVAYDTLGF